MIARIWRGIVRANAAEECLRHLREHILPAYKSVDGGLGIHILLDAKGEFVTVLLLSFWESRAALDAFDDPQLYPEINREEREFLLASESAATVYEVANKN
jgi:heme-degrading monooxygenase HmoA